MKLNLLKNLPELSDHEVFQTLLEQDGVRIERIVSIGQSSPPGFWYDQAEGEWVMLLSGSAGLRFADPDEIIELTPGDTLYIPAHRRHRVDWTSPEQPSVWLAVFHRGF